MTAVKQTQLRDRFWDRVDVRSDDECWEWQGARDKAGYGWTTVDGKTMQTHRRALELVNGSIPRGKLALHHCDNPPCVNPNHLYAGSSRANARDRDKRNRNGRARLNRVSVRRIRAAVEGGQTHQKAADAFGVSRATITRIVNRQSWRHV